MSFFLGGASACQLLASSQIKRHRHKNADMFLTIRYLIEDDQKSDLDRLLEKGADPS